jgi:hypothetical protein
MLHKLNGTNMSSLPDTETGLTKERKLKFSEEPASPSGNGRVVSPGERPRLLSQNTNIPPILIKALAHALYTFLSFLASF